MVTLSHSDNKILSRHSPLQKDFTCKKIACDFGTCDHMWIFHTCDHMSIFHTWKFHSVFLSIFHTLQYPHYQEIAHTWNIHMWLHVEYSHMWLEVHIKNEKETNLVQLILFKYKMIYLKTNTIYLMPFLRKLSDFSLKQNVQKQWRTSLLQYISQSITLVRFLRQHIFTDYRMAAFKRTTTRKK